MRGLFFVMYLFFYECLHIYLENTFLNVFICTSKLNLTIGEKTRWQKKK